MPGTRQEAREQVDDVVADLSKENQEHEKVGEDPAKSTDPPRSKFRAIGFSRMPTTWNGENAEIMATVQATLNERIQKNFRDAYQVMHDLLMIVRTPMVNEDGEVLTDQYGFPEWQRTPSGGFVEDWSKLGRQQREDFLFSITTRLFMWRLAAAEGWTEAMMAKSIWEENFSQAYIAPLKGTIEDRTSEGRAKTAEDRYFGVFCSAYSKRADAIVGTMELLGQRLKDTFDLS
jgi:hypothetical protein